MAELGTIIVLDDTTRKLYCQYDYGYFLRRNIAEEKYSEVQIQQIHEGYAQTSSRLKQLLEQNKQQGLFHIDGAVRKMHSGGLLPSRFKVIEVLKD